jgi:hypothetical protein
MLKVKDRKWTERNRTKIKILSIRTKIEILSLISLRFIFAIIKFI